MQSVFAPRLKTLQPAAAVAPVVTGLPLMPPSAVKSV